MKKILIPTDFSENSYNAIEFAMELYKQEECTFFLLNTIYDSDNILHSSIYEIYKERSLKELNVVENKMREKYPDAAFTFEKIATVNLLNEEIITVVNEKEIDLIVMGTKGATGAKEILFGTYTVSAIKVATCPILAIPEGYTYKKAAHIVLATDYKVNFEQYQLELIEKIAERNQATFHALHVNVDYKPMTPAQEESKEALKNALKNVNVVCEEVDDNDIQGAIFKYDATNPIDLLVMIKNKHSYFENLFFGSEINRIGYHVTFPYLVLPYSSN